MREFEINNNISVNVLAIEARDIYIHRKTNYQCDREISLLLISEDGIKHYTAIKSSSRLLSSSNSKHHGKQHFCTNCLQCFTKELSRDQHQVHCEDNETVRVEMPRKGLTVEFYDGQNQFRIPFMMYADFEAILQPIQSPSPDPNQPYTSEVNQHIPSGWCVYSKFAYGNVQNPLKLYRGLRRKVLINEKHIGCITCSLKKPMDSLTPKQWKRYEKASRCHICFKPFNSKNPKVRDHCHYTGHYRGPAHSLCNLRYRIPSYIPMIFHNLSGYDAHLFIIELGKHSNDIGVIAKTKRTTLPFRLTSQLISTSIRKAMNKIN